MVKGKVKLTVIPLSNEMYVLTSEGIGNKGLSTCVVVVKKVL